MLAALTVANNMVKGTTSYHKYYMEAEAKNDKHRWFFLGHAVPSQTGIIKTYKGNTYIITESSTSITRYHVTDKVKELLGI
jgi:hypothetical protein